MSWLPAAGLKRFTNSLISVHGGHTEKEGAEVGTKHLQNQLK
jgi:hypothetical protein